MSLISQELAGQLLFPEKRQKALAMAQQILAQSATIDSYQTIEALSIVGESRKFDLEPQLAEEAYLKALEIIQLLGDNGLLGQCYQALADTWYFNKNFGRAISYYQQAIAAFELTREVKLLVQAMSQIAFAYEKLGDREQERSYLRKGAAQPELAVLVKATLLERIAQSLAKSGKVEEAILTYEQALSLFEAEGFKRNWQERVQSLAQLYRDSGNEDAAQRTLGRS